MFMQGSVECSFAVRTDVRFFLLTNFEMGSRNNYVHKYSLIMSAVSESKKRESSKLSLIRSEETDEDRFPSRGRVDFERFEVTIFPNIKGHSHIEAVVHWKQINSIIKGSVEAILQGGDLTREQYLNENLFPKNRCSLDQKERRDVYGLYLRYKIVQTEEKLWDDVDKANSLQDLNKSDKKSPISKSINIKTAPNHSNFYCFF